MVLLVGEGSSHRYLISLGSSEFGGQVNTLRCSSCFFCVVFKAFVCVCLREAASRCHQGVSLLWVGGVWSGLGGCYMST